MQERYPAIYDMIGGIEGLLMCADKGHGKLQDIVKDRSVMYDSFTGEAYSVLDSIAETESYHSGYQYLSDEVNKEFMSWGFSDVLLKATDVYYSLLNHELNAALKGRYSDSKVTMITQTPIRGVYYVRISPEDT